MKKFKVCFTDKETGLLYAYNVQNKQKGLIYYPF